jgi:hypothetical protein
MDAPKRKDRIKMSGGKRKFEDMPAGLVNALLAEHLRTHHAGSPDEVDAMNYLRSGAPFKGERAAYHLVDESIRDYIGLEEEKEEHKETIKGVRGHWLKNPEHQEGVVAKGVKFGWWVADDTRILRALLDLEPAIWGEPLWKPLGLSRVAAQYVAEMLKEFAK